MTDSETLLEFPCQFPIKAIGRGNDLEERLFELINPHAPDLDKTTMTSRPSGKGNFIAVTVIITATSQDQIASI